MTSGLHSGFLARPIAHRGLHDRSAGRPENSRAAIRAAIVGNYGIEIDLQLSSDGEAMVFHDYDLGRLTAEHGLVRNRTAAELARIALTGGNEGIPAIGEVLALVGGQVPLLIEIKDQDGGMGPDVGVLEARAIEALEGYVGPVAVMSFNPHSMAACARAAPDLRRGLVTCAFDGADWPTVAPARRAELACIPDIDRVGAVFVSHDKDDLDSPHLERARERDLPILCWTIRSAAEEAAARRVASNVTFERYRPA